MGFVLKEKLKGLKTFLRDWHKHEYGGLEVRIEELVVEIGNLDKKGEEEGLSNQEGDANTKFFHGSDNVRMKSNRISALRVDEGWLESPNLIKAAVHSYFENHVSSNLFLRPKLDGVIFPMLSEVENRGLISPFSLEEIEEMVTSSDGNKCPGPDGFNFAFLKTFWELLKGDLRIMFDQFHDNSCFPKSFLSYFVTLVPKVSSPCSISDFRPISLLGCLYKLIAKVLANRLAKVIDLVISSNQSAFIKGRNLVDGVLVVNEVVESAKKSNSECLIFKVDFEKAYDSVDWGFLEYMLRRCGFYEKWIGWNRVCVFAGNLAVLVNGSPSSEIKIQRGLKQGDPLAPFLFLLVVEGFSGVMWKAVELNLFRGFAIGRDPVVVSHLQYADDTLCIGEASVENLWTLKAILRGFELAFGLKVNFWKSALIGINVSPVFLSMASTFLNCRLGAIPFKNKHISLGGRIVMINAVLNAIPIFYLSFMKMPLKVWKQVVRIQREFLWGGVRGGRKVNWVKWSMVCKAKNKGGLGVRDVRLVNLSLLTKWRWRLLLPGNALWKEVLVAKYGNHILHKVAWSEFRIPPSASKWWKDIYAVERAVESKNWLEESVVRKVGNGNSTLFWSTTWIGEAPLSLVFPRLFSLSNQKSSMVNDFWVHNNANWSWSFSWRRNLFQWEVELVAQLRVLLESVVLSLEEDFWRWRPDPEEVFSVNSTYNVLVNEFLLDDGLEEDVAVVFEQIWDSPAPSKVNCLFLATTS
ncbi:hypothetical protein TSUD_259430 [Trifolium subterraneum]|uniref:Reverse transcriptase domain-containing protein n=1 Tax=Trifolium subterraneum TaxID=3900 RepID=A0A2Z6N8G2_TRISU|nr:hypothetical protein TSUD_259430 [Trifolium subterraneum]